MPPKGESKAKKEKLSQASLFNNHHEILETKAKMINDTWDRIGFNDETKIDRLRLFFESIEETMDNLLESEDELEQKISQSIIDNRLNIRTLCIELGNKFDDKFATGMSMLDEEKILRDRYKQLQEEKKTRLDEYEKLSKTESALCEQLKQKKTIIKTSVPTEVEIESLKIYVRDLDKLKNERQNKMEKYKQEIVTLLYDFDSSQSDSFTELIVYEPLEELELTDEALKKAKDLRDELKVKDEKLNDKIKSTKFKIKQLWTKLCFNNPDLAEIVASEETSVRDRDDINKTELCRLLDEELERCLKIKSENLEKFLEQIRLEISVFYEKLYYSDSEMKIFDVYFKSRDFTEDLLKEHEAKHQELLFAYDENQDLYDKTAKWLMFWEQFVTFEEQTKDPNRFKVRGYNSLDEEKQRKQFSKEFPKLEEELRKCAEEFKDTNGGKVYTIYGTEWNVYLEILRKDYEKHKLEQKNEKKQQSTAVAASKKDNFLYSKHVSKLSSTPSTTTFAKPSIKRKNIDQTPRQTKLQKTEIVENTMMRANTPKIATNKLLAKSKAGTRKSKTPLKSRLRQKNAAVAADTTNNTTTKSTTILSKKGENQSPRTSRYKVPSKLPQPQKLDEDDDSNETTLTATMSSKASSTISSTVTTSSYRNGGYPFKQIEINYQEFSRDLKQPFKFKGNSKGTASSNQVEKDKLTSTFIS